MLTSQQHGRKYTKTSKIFPKPTTKFKDFSRTFKGLEFAIFKFKHSKGLSRQRGSPD